MAFDYERAAQKWLDACQHAQRVFADGSRWLDWRNTADEIAALPETTDCPASELADEG